MAPPTAPDARDGQHHDRDGHHHEPGQRHGHEAPRFCGSCGGGLVDAGSGRGHRVCVRCGRPHWRDPKVGVGVVAVDAAGRLLLVQRAVEPGRGRWALPAGYVDAGDDPREAAAREALEETGLVVAVGRVIDVYPADDPGAGGASFFLAFAADVVGGSLRAGDDAADAGWFGPDELPPLAFASTRAAAGALGGPDALRR